MRHLLLLMLVASLLPMKGISQGHIVSPSDFEIVLGSPWQGTLSYQDYQSGSQIDIKVNLLIERVVEGEYRFNYTYPDEPKANSKDKIKIGKNHMTINKHRIISREKLDDGTLIFEVKELGKDNKKKATIYHRYAFSKASLTMSKKVKFDGTEETITRNKYTFSR